MSEPKLTEEPSSSESSHDHEKKGPEDVCGDGGVLKEIIQEGSGWETPKNGNEVHVHYVGTLLDGTEFDSSRKRGTPFDFKVGSRVISGWSEVIKTMKKGEIAKVTLKPEYAYGEEGSPPSIPPNATLVFEIELLQFTSEKDLTKDKDGGILKKVVVEGEGHSTPSYESKAVVSYMGKVNGAEVDVAQNRLVIIGNGEISEGLEKAIESMKVKEVSEVVITSKYSDMTKTNIHYKIELHSLEKAKDPWECKNYDEVAAAAAERRQDGNLFFKELKYPLAIKKYEKALKFLDQTSKLNDDEKKIAKELALVIHINLALCYFNQNLLKKSLEQTNKALEINPKNTKALYRKGLILAEQDEWELANDEYNKALKLEPDNKSIQLAQKKLQRKIQSQEKRDQKFYGKLFSNFSDEMETERKKEETEKKIEEEKVTIEEENEINDDIKEQIKESVNTNEENLNI